MKLLYRIACRARPKNAVNCSLAIKAAFATPLLLMCFSRLYGQLPCDTVAHPKSLGSVYHCAWKFENLEDTLVGVVVMSQKAPMECGVLASAAMFIIKINSDTIRILDMCNETKIPVGSRVKIHPGLEPGFQVFIPTSHWSEQTSKIENNIKVVRLSTLQRIIEVGLGGQPHLMGKL